MHNNSELLEIFVSEFELLEFELSCTKNKKALLV